MTAIKDCSSATPYSLETVVQEPCKSNSHATAMSELCHGHATAMPRPCHGHATAMSQPCHSRAPAISDKHSSLLMVLLTAAKCFMFQHPGFNTIYLLFFITIKKHPNKLDCFSILSFLMMYFIEYKVHTSIVRT
jgi:hypothetical protein